MIFSRTVGETTEAPAASLAEPEEPVGVIDGVSDTLRTLGGGVDSTKEAGLPVAAIEPAVALEEKLSTGEVLEYYNKCRALYFVHPAGCRCDVGATGQPSGRFSDACIMNDIRIFDATMTIFSFSYLTKILGFLLFHGCGVSLFVLRVESSNGSTDYVEAECKSRVSSPALVLWARLVLKRLTVTRQSNG